MKKLFFTACAVACTVCVISVVCLGQIKMNRSISKSALANVEALTDNEQINVLTCYNTYRVTTNDSTENVWIIVSCDGCNSVEAFEFIDKGSCTSNTGIIYAK